MPHRALFGISINKGKRWKIVGLPDRGIIGFADYRIEDCRIFGFSNYRIVDEGFRPSVVLTNTQHCTPGQRSGMSIENEMLFDLWALRKPLQQSIWVVTVPFDRLRDHPIPVVEHVETTCALYVLPSTGSKTALTEG